MVHDIPSQSVDLIYLDPPFFTGKVQKGTVKASAWMPEAMEVSYEDSKKFWSEQGYAAHSPQWLKDIGVGRPDFASYLFYMRLRLQHCRRVLKPTGSIYLHCDEKASHYLKLIMDETFGWENFKNEIVWCYHGGGISTRQYKKKHDTILFYTKSAKYLFKPTVVERDVPKFYSKGVPVKSVGKVLEDWWDDIPSRGTATNSLEWLGYPTQKPSKLLERIINASSKEGDVILDPFCGCGTAVVVAQKLGREWIGIDANIHALQATQCRCNQLPDNLGAGLVENPIIVRDISAVKQLKPIEFERWVNEYYQATKPNPDRGVDGITPDGIPIQTKTFIVKYDVLQQTTTAVKTHPAVPQPVKKVLIVSQAGFDDNTKPIKHMVADTDGINLELVTPEMLLDMDTSRRVPQRS